MVCIACGEAPPPSWLDRLEPLTPGAEVVPGWVLEDPTRGFEHDIVLPLTGPNDQRIEVHIVDAGRWPSAVPVGAYAVDWEEPHTTGPRPVADAARDAIAAALRPTADGAPPVDEVRIGNEPPTALDPVLHLLQGLGHRPVVPGIGAAILGGMTLVTLVRAGRAFVGLFLASWFVRAIFGPWGPLHANGQGDLWVRGAGDPGLLSHYGPGYPELFGWAARGDGADLAVFAANSALSAAIPAVTALLLWRRGLPDAARWVALWLTFEPIAVRIGATESYLVAGSLAALLAAARPTGPAGDVWVAVLAGFAARLHPTAWPLMALAPAFSPPGTRLRTTVAALLGAVLCSGVVVAEVLRSVLDGRLASPASPPQLVPAVAALLLTVLLGWRARAWLGTGAAALAWAALRGGYGQSPLWQAAFDAAWFPWMGIGAGVLVARGPWPRWTGGALALALLARGATVWRMTTTDEAEHDWSRAVVGALPADCAVAWVARADEVTTTFLPVYAPRAAIAVDARGAFDPTSLPDGCVAYLHASACSTAAGLQRCAKVERALGLDAAEGRDPASLPAVPSHQDVVYATPTVDVWWTVAR